MIEPTNFHFNAEESTTNSFQQESSNEDALNIHKKAA